MRTQRSRELTSRCARHSTTTYYVAPTPPSLRARLPHRSRSPQVGPSTVLHNSFLGTSAGFHQRLHRLLLRPLVGEPIPIKARIKGFAGGKALVTIWCTIKWHMEGGNGRVHTVLLPNSLYSKAAPFRRLLSQHWAQQANDHQPKREGTWRGTLSNRVELEQWSQQNFKRTVLLDPTSNMALFHTAPSYDEFEASCTIIVNHHDVVAPPLIAFELHPISDNK